MFRSAVSSDVGKQKLSGNRRWETGKGNSRVKGKQRAAGQEREENKLRERPCDPETEMEKPAGPQNGSYSQVPSVPGAVPVSAHLENKFTSS